MNYYAKRIALLLLLFFILAGNMVSVLANEGNNSLSEDAKEVVLHEFQHLIVAMASPPEAIAEEKDQAEYIAACFQYWKKEVVRVGKHYDNSVNHNPSTILQPMRVSGDWLSGSLAFELGAMEGAKLAFEWNRRIDQEILNKGVAFKIPPGESRKVVADTHHQIEAIIYLSQILENEKGVDPVKNSSKTDSRSQESIEAEPEKRWATALGAGK